MKRKFLILLLVMLVLVSFVQHTLARYDEIIGGGGDGDNDSGDNDSGDND